MSDVLKRAEAAARRVKRHDATCDHPAEANAALVCVACTAAVIAEEIRASEEKVEALVRARLAWVALACAYKSGSDVAHHRTVADYADARARELGAL